jgi:hypothetical protein
VSLFDVVEGPGLPDQFMHAELLPESSAIQPCNAAGTGRASAERMMVCLTDGVQRAIVA